MTHLLRLVMQRRRIPVLDALFDRISLLLWPRFKQVFDANLKSIKSANIKKLGPVDVTPHDVSRCALVCSGGVLEVFFCALLLSKALLGILFASVFFVT